MRQIITVSGILSDVQQNVLVRALLFVLKVVVKDPDTGHVSVHHPLRRVYFTVVSVVLFFAPLFVMAVTYTLVTSSRGT